MFILWLILLTVGSKKLRGADNPKSSAKRAFSSVGRASPLQGEGQKFESSNAHHLKKEPLKVLFFALKEVIYIYNNKP